MRLRLSLVVLSVILASVSCRKAVPESPVHFAREEIAMDVRPGTLEVRGMYHRKLKTPGASWQEIQARKPPPDPTIIFLGEHWWKLPSIALAVLAALWWVLERIGVSGFLLQLTGFR